MDTTRNYRFPPDSPYREQRLAFMSPEIRNEPPSEPYAPEIKPPNRTGAAVKTAFEMLNKGFKNPETRDRLAEKAIQLRATTAVHKAFENLCQNRTFAREHADRTYGVTVSPDGKATVTYKTTDGRSFVSSTTIDMTLVTPPQTALTQQMEKLIVDDQFGELIGPQIKQ